MVGGCGLSLSSPEVLSRLGLHYTPISLSSPEVLSRLGLHYTPSLLKRFWAADIRPRQSPNIDHVIIEPEGRG